MEEKTKEISFYILIKIVEVQNFVRTKKIAKLDYYIQKCDKFVEYLVLIALLEINHTDLVQILEMLCDYFLKYKNKKKSCDLIMCKIFELMCKSNKYRGLRKILIKYYFEDSDFLSKDFAKIKNKLKRLKDLIIVDVFERVYTCFFHNEYIVVALFCYLHMYFNLEDNYLMIVSSILYVSARKPITMKPEIYKKQDDECFLTETCFFWMNLNDMFMKNKMITEYKIIVQRINCFIDDG